LYGSNPEKKYQKIVPVDGINMCVCKEGRPIRAKEVRDWFIKKKKKIY